MVTTGDDVAAEADREPRIPADHFRSVAQLNMLHSLAAKLNSLGDAYEISSAITAELRTIVDYHSCRVYLLQPDGRTLYPVSFRGEMFSDYEKDTVESLITEIGEGITGHVAESRDSLITPDARDVAFAVQIPGTDDVLESMLAVPMAVGDQLLGVITLSMLGYGKFDEEDQRLLEVLASHAAVALQNAKLFQAEREAAETSTSLLRLSQTLTQLHSVEDILQEAIDTVPHLVAASGLAAFLRDEETGDFHLLHLSTAPVDPAGRRGAAHRDHGHTLGRRDAAPGERVRALRDPAGRRRTGASRVLVARRGPRGAGRPAALGAGWLRRPGVGSQGGRCAVHRPGSASGPRDRRHHVARPRQRTTPLGVGAVPRARRQPGCGLLGGGRRLAQTLVHRGPRRTAPGRQRAGVDRGGAPMGRSHAARRSRGRRHGRPDRRRRRPGPELGVPRVRARRPHDLDPRHGARGAQRPGPATAPRPDDRHHGAQARRAGPATERAQVLGSVPSRTRSSATTPRAR